MNFIEKKRAIQPRVGCQRHRHPHHDRQRAEFHQIGEKILAPTLHRKPAQLIGKHILKNDDVNENTDRLPHRAADHDGAVGQRAAPVSDQQCETHCQQRAHDQHRQQHRQRRHQPRGEYRGDFFVGGPTHAEIAGDDLRDKYPQLHIVRLINANLPAYIGDLLRIGNLARQQVRGVAADPVKQDEHQQHHAQQRGDELQQTADDKSRHGRTSISMYKNSCAYTGCFLKPTTYGCTSTLR